MPRAVTVTELKKWLGSKEVAMHTWANPRMEGDNFAEDFRKMEHAAMGESSHNAKYFSFGIDTRDMKVWYIKAEGNKDVFVRDDGKTDETILDEMLRELDKKREDE